MRAMLTTGLAGIAALAAGVGAALGQVATFEGLSRPFGPESGVGAISGVSGDGVVVVGGATWRRGSSYSYSALRWRSGEGFDRPVSASDGALCAATGVSDDGCVVVGFTSSASGTTGWIVTGDEVERLEGRAISAVSSDGTACVGWSAAGPGREAPDRAGVYRIAGARWTEIDPAATGGLSRATGVSADGSVVVGEMSAGGATLDGAFVNRGTRAARLASRAGMLSASGVCVSDSGEVIAGSNMEHVDDPREGVVFDRVAWLWTAGAGVVEVAGDFEVRAISPDGRLLVGARLNDEYGTPEDAIIWDGAYGAREVRTLLEQVGLAAPIAGWIFRTADAVGQRGTRYAVAGTGLDPGGNASGWVATFDLPPAPGHAGGPDGGAPRVERSGETPAAAHVDQKLLTAIARSGDTWTARRLAFDIGDVLFNTTLNQADGVGARVGHGMRFTRMPRPDLRGPGEWSNHLPARTTGPNAASCNACHGFPSDDGAGRTESNVVSDPFLTGRVDSMIQRNTPHLFGAGAVQRLAEEMTEELRAIARAAGDEACRSGAGVTRALTAKGVSFGSITATPSGGDPCRAALDTSAVEGVDGDLLVRPFRWKGSDATLRAFSRLAAHDEIGMQAVEVVGRGEDGDFDGVTDELSVGDITALVVYIAGQPRPTTGIELAALGLIDEIPPAMIASVERGRAIFAAIGCAACHVPSMTLNDPVFVEPSANPSFRDTVFPAGQNPAAEGLCADVPVRFDLTRDHTDNRILGVWVVPPFSLGSFQADQNGRVPVMLYSDLKRHEMGPELAEPVDQTGTGASVFLTRPLWGVGSTAPYLHDGRATTLAEAILAHGGESKKSRDAFGALSEYERGDVIEFLKNLVLYKQD